MAGDGTVASKIQGSRGMKAVAGGTAAVIALGSLAACGSTSAQDGREAGALAEPTWVVSLGDSYISGEAGQWQANTTNLGVEDMYGPQASRNL